MHKNKESFDEKSLALSLKGNRFNRKVHEIISWKWWSKLWIIYLFLDFNNWDDLNYLRKALLVLTEYKR